MSGSTAGPAPGDPVWRTRTRSNSPPRSTTMRSGSTALSTSPSAILSPSANNLAARVQHPGTSVHAHNDGERPGTRRAIEHRIERCFTLANVNHFGRRRRGRDRNEDEGGKSVAHRATIPW